MIFGCKKRNLFQEAFYLGKDQIEITLEYKYIGIHFYSVGYFGIFIKLKAVNCMY